MLTHLEIKHLLICQKHKDEVLPLSLAVRKQRCTFNWWVPPALSRNPELLPFSSSAAPTEDIREEKREAHKWVGESGGHWARSQLPIQRRQLPGSTPPHLFTLTPLYAGFHLKAPTTYLETEMDRKTGWRRESRAICQNSCRMLTAAACVEISTCRRWKMANLKGDRKEDVEGKDGPFHSIKASNVIWMYCVKELIWWLASHWEWKKTAWGLLRLMKKVLS